MHHAEAAHRAVELTWHFWFGLFIFAILLVFVYVFLESDEHE